MVLGDLIARICSLVFLMAVFASWVRLSQASRQSLNNDLEKHKRLVSRYSKFLDELHPMYQIIQWEQVAHIVNGRGDTKEFVALRARVLRSDLQLIRLVFGCGWPQPAKYRRKVTFTVRNLFPGDTLGTSPPITHSWLCEGRFDLIIQLPTPPRVGSEIGFAVSMDWPGKCAPLMTDAVTDVFAFRFVQQDVKYVTYRVVLPPGYDAYHEPIGIEHDDVRTSQTLTEDGRRQYVFEAFDLPIMHRAGFKLQLAGRTRPPAIGRGQGLDVFRTPASPPE
nr:hypothetical protein [Kibdelosporangium sp. MJ126-NF4]CTQ96774.1 hypothetical protein [Kibdelosporangium sp. MJ126-NF4]